MYQGICAPSDKRSKCADLKHITVGFVLFGLGSVMAAQRSPKPFVGVRVPPWTPFIIFVCLSSMKVVQPPCKRPVMVQFRREAPDSIAGYVSGQTARLIT